NPETGQPGCARRLRSAPGPRDARPTKVAPGATRAQQQPSGRPVSVAGVVVQGDWGEQGGNCGSGRAGAWRHCRKQGGADQTPNWTPIPPLFCALRQSLADYDAEVKKG